MSSKQREELQRISAAITVNTLSNGVRTIACTMSLEEVKHIVDTILAEPLRNCDVGSIQEQAERFRRFCGTHKPEVNEFSEQGELLCPSTGCELIACNYGQCALSWAHLPYEREVKESEVKNG